MIINKAHWTTEGDNLKFSMPISKVDAERRTVSGFATLDNIDKQNDVYFSEFTFTPSGGDITFDIRTEYALASYW